MGVGERRDTERRFYMGSEDKLRPTGNGDCAAAPHAAPDVMSPRIIDQLMDLHLGTASCEAAVKAF